MMTVSNAKKFLLASLPPTSSEKIYEAAEIILTRINELEEKNSLLEKILADSAKEMQELQKKVSLLEKNFSAVNENFFKLKNHLGDVEKLPGEIWKNVKGFEEFYQVSNFGRIKSFHGGNKKILKTYVDSGTNYYSVTICGNEIRKKVEVHRLVAQAFIPNPENKPMVNHKDGNKQNNHVENLEWVTCKENTQHAIKLGLRTESTRGRKGEKNNRAKLTVEQVKLIRENYKPRDKTFGAQALAKNFNVDKTTIQKIVSRKTWGRI